MNFMTPPDTERLRLRHFAFHDAQDLLSLDSDPLVMRYLEKDKYTLEKELEIIPKVREYYERFPGYGAWIAELKDTGEFVGWFSLKHLLPPAECDDIEIGYRTLPKFWGKGLATEMARNIVDYGFKNFPLGFICGVTDPGNVASIRVLEKAGMRYIKNMPFHGWDVVYYQVDRPQ